MGNNSSHRRTKVPKQARRESPPDMGKAGRKPFFSHFKRKKPSVSARALGVGGVRGAKIVLLFPADKLQQPAEVAAGAGARPGRPREDAAGIPGGSPAAAPTLRGAGDGAAPSEGARAREMKTILALRGGGRRGRGRGGGRGAEAAQGGQWLEARPLSEGGADREADPAGGQPRQRGRRAPGPAQ
uniref:Uncharacterized protein n=1 Tax=Canis lupus familiaris TaxID=9615 RepID=A0A8I3PTJ3_CANLF